MLDNFAGSLTTAKGCLHLPENHRFVGCEKDSAAFQDVVSSPMEVHAKQILSPDSAIAGARKPMKQARG